MPSSKLLIPGALVATNQKVACSSHAGRTIESRTSRKLPAEVMYHEYKYGWAVGWVVDLLAASQKIGYNCMSHIGPIQLPACHAAPPLTV